MLKTSIPGLDEDLLRGRTRDQLSTLRHAPPDDSEVPQNRSMAGSALAPRQLLELHGEEFLRRSWLALAGVEPEPETVERQMAEMRSGARSKVEILGEISRSPHGLEAGTALPGLWWRLLPFRVARVPVLGGLLRFAAALYRLPKTVLRANILWAEHCNAGAATHVRADGYAARRLREELADARERIRFLEQAVRPRAAPPPRMDELYLDFENVFRGSREEIKGRLGVYLPHLQGAGAGKQDAPVLDIGCGRGEWLELLREQGLAARGVDLNQATTDMCTALGLEVETADALRHLSDQPAQSLGAITAFHLIEHLPLETLVALLDAAHRALVPGGVLILETPNPENLIVGACSFHRDPTHLRPIHPETALFLLNQRGFRDVRYSGLNPFASPDMDQVPEGFLRRLFFAPQDYMIIGYK